ncbi:phage protein Gp27 family protein [Pasteurella multocida]|uniref:phage protein Gp27 family protein n=1 Tax=Pasteurella multocida TaxID=747 RepID=UPI002021B0F0|nr:phage protein Gp27 family protein [Pasteurella multocida]MCL7841635.1 DUF3486 family protein [Pasteurella multocida]HDR1101106.1 DUF3486 family protein [Pasteurella multocida]HDR1154895.1 DUF3486 family protein [Pasteurella multocida]HDR1156845.1 DUF3486 family protein [Pasteurella multocida]HDR1165934.1 DUF3486 family protein [Pasteurella multocida]
MPKGSTLAPLPQEIIEELQNKIRDCKYTQNRELAEWLQSKGFNISKSALHRFSQKLKEADGYTAKSGTNELVSQINNYPFKNNQLMKLYARLGKLEYEKQEIVRQIDELLTTK